MNPIVAHVGEALQEFFDHPAVRSIGRLCFWIAVIGTSIFLVAFVALLLAVNQAHQDMPSYEEIRGAPAAQTIRYRASNGQIIYESGPAYGEWIKFNEIPRPMTNAIIAIEDRRFFEHPGIDPVAIGRVIKFAVVNRGNDRRLQGASTITQQASRTLFLNRKYEVGRKIKEMVLALAMEQKFSKAQILEIYLNKVYLGGGAHGLDAASRTFFGHSAKRLTNAEAAVIAGAAKAPSQYAPTSNPKDSIARSKTVLAKMLENRRISPAQFTQANKQPPRFFKATKAPRDGTRYFLDWIAPQVESIAPLTARNIDVYTTLDLDMQKTAEATLEAQAGKTLQGAIVTIENNGALRAMVGGRSYTNSNYNRATQAIRQPGSSFKPFVYMAALENGYTPSSMVLDAPITIAGWSPKNNSRRYSGMMTLSSAFAWSINTVAVRLGKDVGFEKTANMAQRFGITTPIAITPSIALGTPEVRVLEMARAYSIISNQGEDVLPYGIETIRIDNEIVYRQPKLSAQAVVRPNVAARMTKLMTGTVERGTGTAAQIGRPMAGKTGTTSSGKDGWFIGFSSGITTAVWIGRDDAKPIAGLQGGRTPARIFSSYMKTALKDRKSSPLTLSDPEPGAVEPVRADPATAGTGGSTPPARTPRRPDVGVTVTRGSSSPVEAPTRPDSESPVTDNTKSRIVPME